MVTQSPGPLHETLALLTPTVLLRVYDQAAREYPNECCGFVQAVAAEAEADDDAPSDAALGLTQCVNQQDRLHALDPQVYTRTARTAYQIQGKQLLTLVRSFESAQPVRVIYHSHCDVGAYFSSEDVAAADNAGYPVRYLVLDARPQVHGALLFEADASDGGAWRAVAAFDAQGLPCAVPVG